ncbi:hypothetical protein D3C87_768510 [compost metagenome]
MTTFNFKVRAVDNKGAFADRDFSMDVRNTAYDKFVMSTAEGYIVTSVDGINWQYRAQYLNAGIYYGEVQWGPGFWFATKTNTTYIRSIDGINWTEHSYPTGYAMFPSSLTANYHGAPTLMPRPSVGDGKLVMLLEADTSTTADMGRYLAYTTDGLSWTVVSDYPITKSATLQYRGVSTQAIFANDRWYVNHYAQSGWPLSDIAMRWIPKDFSADWTNVVRPNGATGFGGGSNIKFINGTFFIWSNSAIYMMSPDGINWTTYTRPTINSAYYYLPCMLYCNGKLISYPDAYNFNSTLATTGSWDKVYTSLDGVVWSNTTVPAIPFTHPSLVNYAEIYNGTTSNGRIFGTYYGGVILFGSRVVNGNATYGGLLTSTDGINWSRNAIPSVGLTNAVTVTGLASMGQNA